MPRPGTAARQASKRNDQSGGELMRTRRSIRPLPRIAGLVIGVAAMLTVANGARGQVAYEVVHAFSEGESSHSPLIQATDGSFYGTTTGGGTARGGTVFRLTASGRLTTLHAFDCSDGCFPVAGLIQGQDGAFYGTTQFGGPFQGGTVFKVTAAGNFTTVHAFDCSTEGCFPMTGLIQDSD